MSKVIKDPAGFIPERIVTEGEPQATVWGNVITESGNHSAIGATPSRTETTNVEQRNEDPHLLDADFSSPLANENGGDPAAAPIENQPPDTPPIDINAIAEEHYNMGFQAGIEQAQNEYGASIQTLLAICEQLSTLRETILQNSAGEIRKMVLLIAEKIIRHSVGTQQQTVLATVNEALNKALQADDFVIFINPEDLEVVSSHSADFIASVNGLKNIVIKPDATIDQGGCFLESSTCTVDATIVNQLQVIAETLKD